MSEIPYGLLLTFDGYGSPTEITYNKDFLYKLLQDLPPAIGMRALGKPHIVSVDEPGIAGISGFTFIMESHISIHTYSERGFVTIDIYSCKDFNTELAASLLQKAFQVEFFETQTLVRGRNFNRLTSPARFRSE
ncbi:MAG: hypothetical protein AB202_01895 [Parcubacteria bacterium C7867-007]|nr:MAG: hypothetical protein AB202_01895 [Parcubacteria bacterium C7867-007]